MATQGRTRAQILSAILQRDNVKVAENKDSKEANRLMSIEIIAGLETISDKLDKIVELLDRSE